MVTDESIDSRAVAGSPVNPNPENDTEVPPESKRAQGDAQEPNPKLPTEPKPAHGLTTTFAAVAGLLDQRNRRLSKNEHAPAAHPSNTDKVFSGWETALGSKLESMIRSGQEERKRALVDGDYERAATLLATGKLVVARRVMLRQSVARFPAVCPLHWLHGASFTDCRQFVGSDKLWTEVAQEPNPASKWFVLLGATGLGKSSALGVALKRAASQGHLDPNATRNGYAAKWVQARDVGRAVREHPLGQGRAPILHQALFADLLIFDDLGLEGDHGEILDVLEERYQRGRVTWTTSGLSTQQLSDRYGAAFYRRLTGGGVEGRGALVDCT